MQKKSGQRPGNAEVICFDLCGTVADWNGAFRTAFEEAVGEWMGRWNGEAEREDIVKSALRHYKAARKSGAGRHEALRSALALLPIDADERIVRHVANRIRALQPERTRFVNGAETALKKLSAQYRIAVITNLDAERAQTLWKKLELGRFMKQEDLFPASPELRKPSKRLYQLAAERMGVPPHRCVMVGNSYKQDVSGALSGGWQAVWIRGSAAKAAKLRMSSGRPIYVLRSVRMLPRLLKITNRKRS